MDTIDILVIVNFAFDALVCIHYFSHLAKCTAIERTIEDTHTEKDVIPASLITAADTNASHTQR